MPVSKNSDYLDIYNIVISKININDHIYFATNSGVLIDEQKKFDNFIKNVIYFKDEIKRLEIKSNFDLNAKIDFMKKNGKSSSAPFNKELHQEANSLGNRLEKPVRMRDSAYYELNINL